MERVRGKLDYDGLERVSSQAAATLFEAPPFRDALSCSLELLGAEPLGAPVELVFDRLSDSVGDTA